MNSPERVSEVHNLLASKCAKVFALMETKNRTKKILFICEALGEGWDCKSNHNPNLPKEAGSIWTGWKKDMEGRYHKNGEAIHSHPSSE